MYGYGYRYGYGYGYSYGYGYGYGYCYGYGYGYGYGYCWYGAHMGGPKYYAVNLILRLFLYHFCTYNKLVTSQIHLQQHKQPTNTTTMVMELLAPPAA
jgi:hypothetical protein